MYADGRGVPQDDEQAADWYRKAADRRHVPAQVKLGAMYAKGRGIPKDPGQAVFWSQRAAAAGNPDGQFNLAVHYAKGEGISKDPVRAYVWFDLAVAQGDEEAGRNRDEIRKSLTDEQFAEARKLSGEFAEQIAGGSGRAAE